MKILITGGSGFIGSKLVLALSQVHEIISLDHGKNYAQLQKLVGDRTTLVKGDILNSGLLEQLLPGVDVVIHFAGGGGRKCLENPTKAVMDNIYGTHLLLQKSLKHDIKKFIFASSVAAYCTFTDRGILKEDMELKPDDFYGALKAVSEYKIIDSINYVILRFSNVYGFSFNIHSSGVIGKFITSAYAAQDLVVHGRGEQRIDYVYIDDLVGAVIKVLEPSIKRKIFNIGGGKLHSIKEIAEIIVALARSEYEQDIKIRYEEADKIYADRLLSIEKAKKFLDWYPSISLREGILDTMRKYKNYIESNEMVS